jgi:RNA polymerase sigma-70 factor (ECF subfamily)
MPHALAQQTPTAPLGWPADRWPLSEADPDAALLRRLRAGDEHAFAHFVRRHHEAMVHVAMGFVASRAVAEEVVQETWLGFIKGLETFEGRASLRTWLYRILVNRARTRGARESRVIPFAALAREDEGLYPEPTTFRDGAWASSPRPWNDPERRLMSLEARAALRTALAQLPARQRAVVTLRDVEGLDASETAELLGLTDVNMRVLLHRGRTALRAALAEVAADPM